MIKVLYLLMKIVCVDNTCAVVVVGEFPTEKACAEAGEEGNWCLPVKVLEI